MGGISIYGWNIDYMGGLWIEYECHMGYIGEIWEEWSRRNDQYHKKWKI